MKIMNHDKKEHHVLGGRSPLFIGKIGEIISPKNFPTSNYIINNTKYDYEGNWAFCSFNNKQIYAARFGFGCGIFDISDFGPSFPWKNKSIMVIHIELMTSKGALLWICKDKFTVEQVKSKKDRMYICLYDGENNIFQIQGWPDMQWRFMTNDKKVKINVKVNLEYITILPDNLLPNNLFAMWVAIGKVWGDIIIEDKSYDVNGIIFYDHPRIVIKKQDVLPFGWFLYTPTYFNDGSYLISFYTCDYKGDPIANYCFGLYIDRYGNWTWLEQTNLKDLIYDDDDKPKTWQQDYEADGIKIKSNSHVKSNEIKKSWGDITAHQTRKDNTNIPLVFDTEAEIKRKNNVKNLRGSGLGELMKNE